MIYNSKSKTVQNSVILPPYELQSDSNSIVNQKVILGKYAKDMDMSRFGRDYLTVGFYTNVLSY